MSDETNTAVLEATSAMTSDEHVVATPVETTATEGRAASVTDGAKNTVDDATVDDGSAALADAPNDVEPTLVTDAVVTEVVAVAAETEGPDVAAAEPNAEETTPQTAATAGESPGEQAPVAAADDADQAAGATAGDQEELDENGQPVVRLLSVGQEVTGVVKRISEFGAFVDIGVGRDGLVHISELSPRRIAKVTDVLQEGQQTSFWIKKLDRDRNRISLTMIEPGTKTIRNMDKGDIVEGKVTRIMPYGAFIDIGIGRDALLHVREMGERYIAKPEDVVQVDETIEARIIDISRRRARVDLSIKGLRPEPEPEPQPVYEQQNSTSRGREREQEREPEPEVVDNFADAEVLSPFAAALRRAEEVSGVRVGSNKNNKKKKRQRNYELDEEIFERTLNRGGN